MHGSTWSEHFKQVLDGLSIFTAVGALVDMLPEVAALFTIIWTGIRIYETETVQKIFKKGEE